MTLAWIIALALIAAGEILCEVQDTYERKRRLKNGQSVMVDSETECISDITTKERI